MANLTAEFKQEHNTISWIKISRLRHRLVCHYKATNRTVICAIIYDGLPKFLGEPKQLGPKSRPIRGLDYMEPTKHTGSNSIRIPIEKG